MKRRLTACAVRVLTLVMILSGCGGGGGGSVASGANPGANTATVSTNLSTAPSQPASTASPSPPPSASPDASLENNGLAAPRIDGVQIFPADNPWNTDISNYPVDSNSDNYLASMNAATTNLHPDFGSDPSYGIPYAVVSGDTQPKVPVSFLYASESNPGPYPIPPNVPIEAGSDHHVIVLDKDNALLYEMDNAAFVNPGWTADSGAVFNLNSNALRPDYWTSADAAGLPILAGLARYDEVTSGVITHALRFTVATTQRAFIHPATHYASSNTSPNVPPMGLRVRLKATFDLSGFTGESLVILTALQRYGMMVADNGSDWFITGDTDPRWDDNDLNQIKTVPASAFEVVQSGSIIY